MGDLANSSYAVGFSGGSGIAYGLRLVHVLLELGAGVHLCATDAAVRVLKYEAGIELDPKQPELKTLFTRELGERLSCYHQEAVEAAPSSGSAGIAATIICPCSMGTLARIAHGFSSNLLERSADVALKEGRRLILVPRETPLSSVHLRNMLKLSEAGAVVLPAMPGFYHRPQTVAQLVDFVVAKILDRLGVDSPLVKRWKTPTASSSPWDEGEEVAPS
ncbi:MAG: flavin prenyltransferase UbiX [Planctomycetota bacterium]